MGGHPEFDRANTIRKRMSGIRQDLHDDVQNVEKSARTLLNWRYYTDNYPWACVAVATALGYMLVPRKLEISSPDPKTMEKLAKKNRLVVENKPKAEAKGGLVGAAFSFVSGLVLKTAMAQVGHQLAAIMESKDESASKSPSPEPRRTATTSAPHAPHEQPLHKPQRTNTT